MCINRYSTQIAYDMNMMAGFVFISVLGAFTIGLTTLVTYEVMRLVWNTLPRLEINPRLRVLLMMLPIFLTHIVNIWLYGITYLLVERFGNLGHLSGPIGEAQFSYASFIERLYFSASTYASLGLGDITPVDHLRMLAAAEVLNGLVLLGWTVSFTYLAMEKFWSMPQRRNRHDNGRD